MLKVKPHQDYPPEDGNYIRGNDYSPVAVAIILNTDQDKVPPELEILVRGGAESGAALSGFVQTENIGFEKIICNIVANPNIRYLILGGPESEGHLTGQAMKALFSNGIDEKKRIIGADSPHPILYNVPWELVTRFLHQTTLVDLQFKDDPSVIQDAVHACYQERPTEFNDMILYDRGAYPHPPLSGKLTWKVTQPWAESADESERMAREKALELMEKLRQRNRDSTG